MRIIPEKGTNMTEREREVIVTDGGNRGGGMIVAVIIGILGILLAVWLFMNLGGDGEADVIPDEVNVTIDTGEGGGGGEGGEG
jgi:hypothetical protein